MGVVTAGDRAEAGIQQHRAAETVAQSLDQLVGRIRMQAAQVGRQQVRYGVNHGRIGGACNRVSVAASPCPFARPSNCQAPICSTYPKWRSQLIVGDFFLSRQ